MEHSDVGDTPVSTPLPPTTPNYAQHPPSPCYKMQLGKRFCMPKLFPQTPTRFLHLNPMTRNGDRSATPTIPSGCIGNRASIPRSNNSMVVKPLGLAQIGSKTDLLSGQSNRNGARRHSIVTLTSAASPDHTQQQREEPDIPMESEEEPAPIASSAACESTAPCMPQAPLQAPRFILAPQHLSQVSQPPVVGPSASPTIMGLQLMRPTGSPAVRDTALDAKAGSLDITANMRPGTRPVLSCRGFSVPDSMGLQVGNKMQPTPSRNQIAQERFKELEAKAAEVEVETGKTNMVESVTAPTQQAEVQNLKADFDELVAANDALRAEKMDLTRDLDDIKVEAAVLKASNATMAAKNDELETENVELKAKLAEAQLQLTELEGLTGRDIKGLKGKLREVQMQYDATRLLNEELRTRLAKSITASQTNSPFASQQDSRSVKSEMNSPSTWSCASSNSMIPLPRTLAARRAAAQSARHSLAASTTTRPLLRSLPSGKTALATRTSLPASKLGDKARPKPRPSLPLANGNTKAKAKVRPTGTPTTEADQMEPWWKEEDTAEFEKMEALVQNTSKTLE